MHIERVHSLRAGEQALALRKFVKNEADNDDPAIDNYRQGFSRWHEGVFEIIYLSQATKLASYLLRRCFLGEVVGVGTVIRNVHVKNTKTGLRTTVHDLDYVLGKGASDTDHMRAAEKIIGKSADLALKHGNHREAPVSPFRLPGEVAVQHKYVSSVDLTNPSTNRGFLLLEHMLPAPLVYVGEEVDMYGLTKGDAPLKLLYCQEEVVR